jgi:hypothetical protein
VALWPSAVLAGAAVCANPSVESVKAAYALFTAAREVHAMMHLTLILFRQDWPQSTRNGSWQKNLLKFDELTLSA